MLGLQMQIKPGIIHIVSLLAITLTFSFVIFSIFYSQNVLGKKTNKDQPITSPCSTLPCPTEKPKPKKLENNFYFNVTFRTVDGRNLGKVMKGTNAKIEFTDEAKRNMTEQNIKYSKNFKKIAGANKDGVIQFKQIARRTYNVTITKLPKGYRLADGEAKTREFAANFIGQDPKDDKHEISFTIAQSPKIKVLPTPTPESTQSAR